LWTIERTRQKLELAECHLCGRLIIGEAGEDYLDVTEVLISKKGYDGNERVFECIVCVEPITPEIRIFIDLVEGMAASTKNNVSLFKTSQLKELHEALGKLGVGLERELRVRRENKGD